MPKSKKSNGKYIDQVSKHAKLVSSELAKNFGVTTSIIDQVLEGDAAASVQIGQLKKDADFANAVLPEVEAALVAHYQATENYNRAHLNAIKQGAKSGSAIRKMRGEAISTNKRYVNDAKENRLNIQLQADTEKNRHSFAMLLARAKSQTAMYLTQTDQRATIQALSNQPDIKQLDADQKYKIESTKHFLRYGDDSRKELIPRKEYAKSEGRKISWLDKLKNVFTN